MTTELMPVLTVEAIDPVTDPDWASFLDRCPGAEVFHHPFWLRLLRDQYGYELRACCVRGEDDEIEAGLPVALIESRLTGRRLVAVPFSDTCSPLLAAEATEGAGEVLTRALGAEAERMGLGLTVHAPLPGVAPAALHTHFVRHELALGPDLAAVEAGFSKSRATRNVRKARREGLTVEFSREREGLEDFYALHLQTRRKLGVPTQPKRFILRFEGLFDAGLGFVATVRDGAAPVAAGVFLNFNGTLTYKYGASDPRALAKRPNNLLHAEAIRWGCEQGLERYDLGRTDLDNEGLRAFKSLWGAEELPLSYTYLRTPPPTAGEDGRLDRVTATVIKRSPALVGRLAGELLYRHYGT
jgi:CelD/BcsL family acetyltransferase involved in cellulose biosynthesis